MMIRAAIFFALFSAALSACQLGPTGTQRPFQAPRTQGVYIPPEYLRPQPTEPVPSEDRCNARLYVALVGRHEGSIYFPGLPQLKRVIKPAILEDFDDDPLFVPPPPLLEVREYIAGQSLYAPTIRTVSDRVALGPARDDRLTIKLDRDGFIREVRCE